MDPRIRAYLLSSLSDEIDARAAIALDVRTQWVYDRGREFYWTISRVLRQLRGALSLSPTPAAAPPLWMTGGASASAGERLLIDVTPTRRHDIKTGIQRVVREVAAAAGGEGRGLPVFIEGGVLRRVAQDGVATEPVDIAPGDKLLLLDAGWVHVDEYPPVIDMARARGAEIVVCLYDLFPIAYAAAFPPNLQRNFRVWYETVVLQADHVCAISNCVARDYLDRSGPRREGQRVGAFTLGSDFAHVDGAATARAQAIAAAGRPMFLSVGSLACTKGQAQTLLAFESLWARGVDAAFVVVGRAGWGTIALAQRLRRHPEHGKRLFWFDDAGDAELRYLYGAARAVICASFAEGFGLPLVEAGRAGAPIIASDIAIFHEVAGDAPAYFPLFDTAALAARIEAAIDAPREATAVAAVSWKEATHGFLALVDS